MLLAFYRLILFLEKWVDSLNEKRLKAPEYQQFEAILKADLDKHRYLPGEKIPSERVIASRYHINRMTAKRAIDHLVTSGLLYRIHGKGTFIVGEKKESYTFSFSGSNSLTDALKNSGMQVTTDVLRFIDDCQSPYLNVKLALSPKEKVIAVHRIRYANKKPFAIEYTYVPQKFFPDFFEIDFRNVGLYDYMTSREHKPEYFQQYIILIHPAKKERNLLEFRPSDEYAYKLNFTSADKNTNILEYTESYINPKDMDMSYDVSF